MVAGTDEPLGAILLQTIKRTLSITGDPRGDDAGDIVQPLGL